MGFQRGSVIKETAYNVGDARDMGSIPGLGRSPGGGHGNPLQYSCLENPMNRGGWRATVHRSQRVRYNWSDWAQLLRAIGFSPIFIAVKDLCIVWVSFLFFFFSRLHHTACQMSVPWPRMEPVPHQWKPWILTTRQPGNSLGFFLRKKKRQFIPEGI